MKLVLFVASFILLCSFQVSAFVIDNFINGADKQSDTFTLQSDVSSSDPSVTKPSFYYAGVACSGLIGCARDISITVLKGLQGNTFYSNITGITSEYYTKGQWLVGEIW